MKIPDIAWTAAAAALLAALVVLVQLAYERGWNDRDSFGASAQLSSEN